MPFDRGDVILVFFPNSDLRTAKRRPAVVVQADRLETGLPQTVVAMVSSNLARTGHPSRVTIKKSDPDFAATGLLTDSVIMTDNLATVLEAEVHGKLGRFGRKTELGAAPRHTLGL
jgi:mRNA interferase MazF